MRIALLGAAVLAVVVGVPATASPPPPVVVVTGSCPASHPDHVITIGTDSVCRQRTTVRPSVVFTSDVASCPADHYGVPLAFGFVVCVRPL